MDIGHFPLRAEDTSTKRLKYTHAFWTHSTVSGGRTLKPLTLLLRGKSGIWGVSSGLF